MTKKAQKTVTIFQHALPEGCSWDVWADGSNHLALHDITDEQAWEIAILLSKSKDPKKEPT